MESRAQGVAGPRTLPSRFLPGTAPSEGAAASPERGCPGTLSGPAPLRSGPNQEGSGHKWEAEEIKLLMQQNP